MSDIKLFRIGADHVEQIDGHSVALEKSLQKLIEKHLEALLGVRFLATEYSTGSKHRGRIDTLGIDENGCPVIIEYKRTLNENVINQGLFYLDWLLDHKAEFQLRVMETLGAEAASGIDWSSPRLLCIAGGFTRYDVHAVEQINRNIELVRYARYGDGLLLLDLVNATVASNGNDTSPPPTKKTRKGLGKNAPVADLLAHMDTKLDDLYSALKDFLTSLGDDVQVKPLKLYVAFRRLKNFACVRPYSSSLTVWTKLDPTTVKLEEGFTRDVSEVGHYGTGNLEITLRDLDDLERAKPLLLKSYEAN